MFLRIARLAVVAAEPKRQQEVFGWATPPKNNPVAQRNYVSWAGGTGAGPTRTPVTPAAPESLEGFISRTPRTSTRTTCCASLSLREHTRHLRGRHLRQRADWAEISTFRAGQHWCATACSNSSIGWTNRSARTTTEEACSTQVALRATQAKFGARTSRTRKS
jgi:hypothetical protein